MVRFDTLFFSNITLFYYRSSSPLLLEITPTLCMPNLVGTICTQNMNCLSCLHTLVLTVRELDFRNKSFLFTKKYGHPVSLL